MKLLLIEMGSPMAGTGLQEKIGVCFGNVKLKMSIREKNAYEITRWKYHGSSRVYEFKVQYRGQFKVISEFQAMGFYIWTLN